jgi:hypothetical protein
MVVALLGGFAPYGIDNHDLYLSAMSYVDCILRAKAGRSADPGADKNRNGDQSQGG